MKLDLIYPVTIELALDHNKKRKVHRKGATFPGLGLLTVASLTPKDVEVTIVDEKVQDIDFQRIVDLVGISTMTTTSCRAYEIADLYRAKGITVVLGGIHPTVMPQEALMHADSIVIGEAENVWANLIRDFRNGYIRKIYKSEARPDLSNVPAPNRDLLGEKSYALKNVVLASRGCPFQCEFCIEGAYFGSKSRFRPIDDVIEELESIKGRHFLLLDNNIMSNPSYYKDLLGNLAHLNKRWVGQSTWNIVNDPDMIECISKSGCIGLFIGFETMSKQIGLTKIPESHRAKSFYMKTIETLHKKGIAVFGGFVFGFDNDDETVFRDVLQFSIESKMDFGQFCIVVPYPGTPLYDRLTKEDRITEKNMEKYIGTEICFQPKRMSAQKLKEGVAMVNREFYSIKSISQRIIRASKNLGDPELLFTVAKLNLDLRKQFADTGFWEK